MCFIFKKPYVSTCNYLIGPNEYCDDEVETEYLDMKFCVRTEIKHYAGGQQQEVYTLVERPSNIPHSQCLKNGRGFFPHDRTNPEHELWVTYVQAVYTRTNGFCEPHALAEQNARLAEQRMLQEQQAQEAAMAAAQQQYQQEQEEMLRQMDDDEAELYREMAEGSAQANRYASGGF